MICISPGFDRAENFDGKPVRDAVGEWRFPVALSQDHWALSGCWRLGAQRIVAEEKGAGLRLDFKISKVYQVCFPVGRRG